MSQKINKNGIIINGDIFPRKMGSGDIFVPYPLILATGKTAPEPTKIVKIQGVTCGFFPGWDSDEIIQKVSFGW